MIIKQIGPWAIEKTTETKYYKHGVANLHIVARYNVVFQASDLETSGHYDPQLKNKFWIKTKASAMAYLNQVAKGA